MKPIILSPRLLLLFSCFFSLLALLPSAYLYGKYQESQARLRQADTNDKEEAKILASRIGKLIYLPENEEPTVVTVVEPEKVRDQQFFAKAKKGDKVLVYNQAKKAILYDPVANKIIEVGPVLIPTATVTPVPTPLLIQSAVTNVLAATQKEVYKLILLNGTTAIGLTSKIEDILDSDKHYEVVDKDNAKEKIYQETLVIDLTGSQASEAAKLADLLKAKVAPLPPGETKPAEIDFLVIVGKDKL